MAGSNIGSPSVPLLLSEGGEVYDFKGLFQEQRVYAFGGITVLMCQAYFSFCFLIVENT